MIHSLKSPILKIERAKETLDLLKNKSREFIQSNPPVIFTEDDINNSLFLIKFKIPIIDPKLGLLAGEVIYQLRSSLDNIAWQLALTTTSTPFIRTAFPIIDINTSQKIATFNDITKDIPKDAVHEIELLQPYHKEKQYKDDLLWKLDKLCNIDKHRIIPAQGTSLDIKIPSGFNPIFSNTPDNIYIISLPINIKSLIMPYIPAFFDIQYGSRIDGITIDSSELFKIYNYVETDVLSKFLRFF